MTAQELPEDMLDQLANALEKHQLYSQPAEEERTRKTAFGNVPSLKAELERKTLDELQRVLLCHQHGKMSDAECDAAVESMWMTTAGLVSKDIMNIVGQARAEFKGLSRTITRTFVSPDNKGVLIVRWCPGEGVVEVTSKQVSKSWTAPADSVIPSKDSREHFRDLCAKLKAKGYTT
jgi:hypothetical protein